MEFGLDNLLKIFQEINQTHFDGFLEPPVLRWNGRLRTSSGRFFPGSKRKLFGSRPPIIEVASYLLQEKDSEVHVRETLAHEMIHYWLWVRNRPYGHTEEFYSKMQVMGARRYNPVPRRRPYKYLYGCGHCQAQFKSRRRLGKLACAQCCKAHGNGKYQERFRLILIEKLTLSSVLVWLLILPNAIAEASLWMVRETGAKQCEKFDLRAAQKKTQSELRSRGVKWTQWQHLPQGASGTMRIQMCGSPTGSRFRVEIRPAHKAAAERAGFVME